MRRKLICFSVGVTMLSAIFAAGPAALAQSGTIGGYIGKRDKSLSDTVQTPVPRKSTRKKSTKSAVAKSDASSEAKLSPCKKAVGEFFWVTMNVTLKTGGVAESPKGNGKWSCSGDKLSVVWDGASHVENFTVTEDGLLTGHWFIKPQRIR